MKELERLKRWLQNPENTAVILAAKLGYGSSSTISQWFARGRIPRRQIPNVLKIIKGGKK